MPASHRNFRVPASSFLLQLPANAAEKKENGLSSWATTTHVFDLYELTFSKVLLHPALVIVADWGVNQCMQDLPFFFFILFHYLSIILPSKSMYNS